jgi:hypothetical protein
LGLPSFLGSAGKIIANCETHRTGSVGVIYDRTGEYSCPGDDSCILGFAIQAGAETMNYRGYTYVAKAEEILIGDVEDHTLSLETRRSFYVFENGEIATILAHLTGDSSFLLPCWNLWVLKIIESVIR